jgi:hypothetical protein
LACFTVDFLLKEFNTEQYEIGGLRHTQYPAASTASRA